jgi:hypothetical protein
MASLSRSDRSAVFQRRDFIPSGGAERRRLAAAEQAGGAIAESRASLYRTMSS